MNDIPNKINDIKNITLKNIKENKKIKISIISTGAVIVISTVLYFNSFIYAVNINNKLVGYIKNKDVISEFKNNIEIKYEQKLNKDVEIPQEITFEKTFCFGKEVKSDDEMKELVEDELNINVEAYAIMADSKKLASLSDKESAETILTNLKDKYLNTNEEREFKEVDFVENVEIIKEYCNPKIITNVEDAFQLISIGTDEIKEYTVEQGDVVSCIAEDYDLSVNEISCANPDIDVDKIQIGQVLNLTVPKPFISVKTVEDAEYIEEIPFETEYKSSDNIYKGDTKISTKGVCGSVSIKAEIIKVNGIESERNILEEETLSEPVTQVVLEGTKPRPKTVAYGSFIKPTTGYLTSPFGWRWGRMHEGVDYGVPTGSSIKAADGGKVTFAGWKGGYGYLVIIDHENGYQSYYGHNSSLKVSAGDRVFRGEVIALSGNTGNSTGPHLHFEIRKNGTPVNPLNYL